MYLRSSARLANLRLESQLDVKLHTSNLQTKPLSGDDKPLYYRPEGIFVDHKTEECFMYWHDGRTKQWQISACRLGSQTQGWKNLTEEFCFNYPGTLTMEKKPLPSHRGAASALWVLSEPDSRIILMFGGQETEGAPVSTQLTAIDINSKKWWYVNVALSSQLSPRLDACAKTFGNRLYVFGGRRPNERLTPIGSFSVAEFDVASNEWKWIVCDQPYPAHVPNMGCYGDLVVLSGEEKLLLTPGYVGNASQIKFSNNVVFDVKHHTFDVKGEIQGGLPRDVIFYDLSSFSSQSSNLALKSGDTTSKAELDEPDLAMTTSVLFAVWGDLLPGVHDIPELWCMTLSLGSAADRFQCLDLQEQLKALNVSTYALVVVNNRPILLGSRSPPDAQECFDICVEVEF